MLHLRDCHGIRDANQMNEGYPNTDTVKKVLRALVNPRLDPTVDAAEVLEQEDKLKEKEEGAEQDKLKEKEKEEKE